jgi:5-methylcytosine-specific restriction endonuclease McrA
MTLSKKQRAVLHAMFGGHCAYCGHELPENGWHADHIEALERVMTYARKDKFGELERKLLRCDNPEADRVDNFFPSCRACNIDKSSMSLEFWRTQLEKKPKVLRDNYSAFRHAERFGLVAQIATTVTFYFERTGDK